LASSINEAFELARLGDQTGAVELLRHEFEKLQSPARRIDLCEWIANCFEKLQDFAQAGAWYEAAGELILAQVGSPLPAAAVDAFREYRLALDCYERSDDNNDDDDAAGDIERCSEILARIKHSFSSS
jgi:tetratricopeptide (TPR) repeat protein